MRRLTHSPPLFRWLRVALTSAFWLQGTFAFWSPPVVHAQNPDSTVVSVIPVSSKPPAAVTDLLASANPAIQGQISLIWTAPQGNAGGTPIANQKVDHYTVGYATFSVDSLSGNTTAWWNNSGITQTVLSPPAYTPQSPGSMEGYTFTGLTPGVTYYFALRSTSLGNILSLIDTEAATPGHQAEALSTSLASTPPTTFTGTALSPTSIQWTWSLVPGATGYLIYSQPGTTLIQTLSDPTTYWIEIGLASNTSYSRSIRSSNSFGPSVSATFASRYTLPTIPLGLTVAVVTSTTADLFWTDGGNPIDTSFDLEHSVDGSSFTPLAPVLSTGTTDTGLLSSTTYFYRVQAVNPDGLGSGYSGIVSTQTTAAYLIPAMPNGVLTSLTGNNFSLEWHSVTADVNGRPITIQQYRIDRYSDIASTGPNKTVYVSAGTQSYSEIIGSKTQFYQVTALAVGGGISAPSDFCDSSVALNRYALAPDDPSTRVVMPAAVAMELRKENNIYGEDLELRLTRRSQDEDNDTLRSYNIGAYIARTGSEVFNFAFSKPIISVQLGYGAALGSTVLTTNQSSSSRHANSAGAGSIAQIIAVYWFNGQNFVRISDPVLTSDQAMSVVVRSLGTYQIRAARIANQFTLSQGSPYPRVITPNGAENRKVVFFFENPTDDVVQGIIYDIHGAKVRDIQVDGQSPTTTSMVWDGRDQNGSVVPSGVYIYKVWAGSDKVTGTLVVAR
jgi:hypothetical protein